ncbi:MAG: hypothetical protein HN356_02840 [Calditrichaeota bacterium]|nr:hypothetical protein [Calditrichota bacterium]MBT7789617.1 hypothetical protein [Calditrichota bacterium]
MISKKIISGIIILSIILTIPSGVLFANGYMLSGVGTKALGMAGAYVSIADDWSAMYWNPAGIAGQRASVNLTAKILRPSSSLKADETIDADGYLHYTNGETFNTTKEFTPLGSVGGTYRINRSLTAGLAVFSPAYRTTEWIGLFTGPPEDYGNTVPYPERAWYSDLKVIDVHPTIAYKVDQKIQIGLGLSLQYASLTMQTPNVSRSIPGYRWARIYIDETLDGTGLGFGLNFGLLYKLTSNMNFGFSVKTPIYIPIDGDFTQNLITPTISGVEGAVGGTATSVSGAEMDLMIPMSSTVGVSYRPMKDLTVAFDVKRTHWSLIKNFNIKMDPGSKGPREEDLRDKKIPLLYDDSYKFSFGLDAKVPGGFWVRGGYYFETTPVPDETRLPIMNDYGDNHSLSLGARFDITKRLYIDGYWEYTQTIVKDVTSANIDGDHSWDNVGGEWDHSVKTGGISVNFIY